MFVLLLDLDNYSYKVVHEEKLIELEGRFKVVLENMPNEKVAASPLLITMYRIGLVD